MTVLEESVYGHPRRPVPPARSTDQPGAISHNEVLELGRTIPPGVHLENFTEEEQAEVIKAPRSNNTMCGKSLRRLP